MNIYDLEKRATPGPLRMSEPTDSGSVSLVGRHESEEVCHTYGNKEELLLLAHCRNHFMEALEALKEIKDEFYQLTNGEGIVHVELSADEAQKIRDLITKLENVE